jgi:hypothetical protein
MTDSPTPPDRLEEWLTSHHRRLADDLAATLDLAAGADEASQPRHYTALGTDIAAQLDLGAGLAAILSPPPPGPEPDHPPTTPTARDPADTADWAAQLSAALRTLDPATRLRLRGLPHYQLLRHTVYLITAPDVEATVSHVVDLVGEVNDIYLALARALDLAHEVNLALARADDLARARAEDLVRSRWRRRARSRELDHALDHALARADDLVHTLYRALDLSRAFGRDLACDLACDLDLSRARAEDLSRALSRDVDVALSRAFGRDLARDLRREIALALALAVARDFGRHHLHLELGPGVLVHKHQIEHLAVILDDMADDFTDVDLGTVSLTGVTLEGIRWSAATRWPPGWAGTIGAMSVKIAPGVFQIQPGHHPEREHTHLV